MRSSRKIVITGGLGYIGTELINLFCPNGQISDDEIIVIDNRFVPDKVSNLISKKIKYYNKDILNLGGLLDGADIIYHLAGITDVAYTNTESTPDKDALIRKVAVEGTREIIKKSPKYSKIIFPSTHVVYEGFTEAKLGIIENEEPCPKLAYAISKRQNELDFMNGDRAFTILRLASVYGYNSSIRLSIVPNLFSKMASQGQSIKLFGGGINYKPLVGVTDVARFMEFVVKPRFDGEIFHLANESLTVEEIATVCANVYLEKTYHELPIIKTNDEIPNKGYTLSNKKILDTGFAFQHNLKHEVEKMISSWLNS